MGEGGGGGTRESLALYKLFYTLCGLYEGHDLPDVCQAAGETPQKRIVPPLELADGRGGKGGDARKPGPL